MVKKFFLILFITAICVDIQALPDNKLSQISEAKIKAALIINFAQNIQWPNDSKISTYLIGIVDPDSSVYKELKSVIGVQKIKGKPFEVKFVDQQTFYSPFNILYFAENTEKALSNIYTEANLSEVLIITDRSKDRVLTMINILYKTDKNTFSFEINKDNLDAGKFAVNPKILLLGGSYLNLKELYIQTYEQLRQESERIQGYKLELERISKEKEEYQYEINQLNSKINNLAKSIKQSEEEYLNLTNKLQVRDSLLAERTKELQNKIQESQTLQELIKSQLASINIATNKLDSLDVEINEKQQELREQQVQIEKQTEEISQQDLIILRQQKRFLIAIIIVLGLSLSLLFAYWAYRIKRNLNFKLEKLVNERTQELQLSREHFRNLFENSPVAMFELDLSELKNYIESLNYVDENTDPFTEDSKQLIENGLRRIKVVSLNQAGINLFGFKDKDDAVVNFIKTYNEQSLDNIKSVFLAIVKKQTSSAYEGVRQTINGDILHVHLKWLVLPSYEESYAKVLLSVTDITALKNYQKELNKHKEHLEDIVLERTNEIIKLNNDLTTTNAELQQKTEELSQIIQMLKNTQDQLIQSEKMASLGMLTAGIAHEINNPVNFISGSYQALQSQIDEFWSILNELRLSVTKEISIDLLGEIENARNVNTNELYTSMQFLLSNIDTGITRTTEIIRSLMAFSRNENQEYRLLDIKDGIRDVLVILKSKYQGKITIDEDYDTNLPLIKCNHNGITQVFMNLISNAIDSINNTGTVAISAKYHKESDEVIIRVKDSGCGIPENIIDKIFDPFFTTKEVGKGTGLGLYMSYNMVKYHMGTITVDTEIGKGTTFTILLPVNANKKKLLS